jgi:hypothetical protein
VKVAETLVVTVGVILRVATPATKPLASKVLALDVKLVAGVGVAAQPVTAGVQVNVTVPVRKAPELPPEDAPLPFAVSTTASRVTLVLAATVILVPNGVAAVNAPTVVVVGAASTAKETVDVSVLPQATLLLAQ